MSHAERLRRLGDEIERRGVGAMLVSNPTNIRYLTGFSGSNAMVIVRPGDAEFLTDFRYLERVRPLAEFIEVKQVNQEILAPAAEQLGSMLATGATAGFEGDHLSHARHQALARELDGPGLTSMSGAVERLRVVKDDDELGRHPPGGRIAGAGLRGAGGPRAGWPHRTRRGLEHHRAAARRWVPTALSSPPIVAAGERGALPHAEPERRCDRPATPSSRSTSAACSTATARIAPARSPPATSPTRWPRPTRSARPRSRPASTPSAPAPPASRSTRSSRDLIEEAGHGEHFSTALGHGVGLDIHEAPRLTAPATQPSSRAWSSQWSRASTCPGVGGVRIEDLVVVTADGAERLTGYPKELITTARRAKRADGRDGLHEPVQERHARRRRRQGLPDRRVPAREARQGRRVRAHEAEGARERRRGRQDVPGRREDAADPHRGEERHLPLQRRQPTST